jgi:hypothetical protein
MAVAAGRDGKITMFTSSAGNSEIAEMGTWSISGPGLGMVDLAAFGDERGRQKPGMVSPQTITFDGYADMSTDFEPTLTVFPQRRLQTFLSSGTPIYSSTAAVPTGPTRFRLWENDDATLDGHGYWTQSSSTTLNVKTYITGMEVGQSVDGVATISFTASVTGGVMEWVAGGTSGDVRA